MFRPLKSYSGVWISAFFFFLIHSYQMLQKRDHRNLFSLQKRTFKTDGVWLIKFKHRKEMWHI